MVLSSNFYFCTYPDGYNLLCELDDGEAKKQERREKARKTVENAFTLRDAASKGISVESKENSGETEKSSADPEESAEELKKVAGF